MRRPQTPWRTARELGDKPLIVTTRGKPIAVLVRVEKMDLESLRLSTNPDFLELIERSRKRDKAEGGMTSAAVRCSFGIKPAKSKPRKRPRKR